MESGQTSAATGAVLWPGRPPYPAAVDRALGLQAPAPLYAAGALALLRRPAVAVVGTRELPPPGHRTVEDLAAGLAAAGWCVVSGGARGTDAAAHRGALRRGGTVLVAPVGLPRCRRRGLHGAPPGQALVLSPFAPGAGWAAARALARNRLIVALSTFVVAVRPRLGGGTWNSCHHALGLGRPLLVLADDVTPAHRRAAEHLARRGAVLLRAADALPPAAELAALAAAHTPAPRPRQRCLWAAPAG
jgi:DNA processing protein